MTDSHCPYCALQCAMTLTRDEGSVPPLVVAGREFPTNRGGLCRKGGTSAELLRAPERLTAPLVRDADGVLREVAWEVAQLLMRRGWPGPFQRCRLCPPGTGKF